MNFCFTLIQQVSLSFESAERTEFPHCWQLLKKIVRLIRAESKRMQLCLQREFPEEKSQSLHSQKPSWWAQQIRHERKNLYFEYCKNVLYAGPKLFDKLRPGPTYYSAGNIISQDFNCLGCCRLSATRSRSGLPYL